MAHAKAFAAGIWIGLYAIAHAQAAEVTPTEAQGLPTYRVLPCDGVCARSTTAVQTSKRLPPFPRSEIFLGSGYIESLVIVQFTVGTDGRTRDVKTLTLLGPDEFQRVTVAAIKDWTFQPATVDEKPVDEIRLARFHYVVPEHIRPGARGSIVSQYSEARRLITESKFDEARTLLEEAQVAPRLNFYERTTLGYVTAQLYALQNDEESAWRWMQLAMLNVGQYLDKRVRESALRLYLVIATRRSEFAGAIEAFDLLKRDYNLKPDDPLVKVMNDIHAAIAGSGDIAVAGRVPAEGELHRMWFHTLVRRTFGFREIKGSLERFQLACDQQAIESPITQTAEWRVPKSWSNCRVVVHGAPGTTFKLMEYN